MRSANNYPFPFFGAGLAHYYEWASLSVRFRAIPTKDQIKKIIDMAPEPLKPETDGFNGKMLSVTSDQFVNSWIEDTYGNGEGKDNDADIDPEFYVSEEAQLAFEEDIERWLLEVNECCPVEFVFRMEDSEAGGTEFSEWHQQSIGSVKQLLEAWKAEPAIYSQAQAEADSFSESVVGILMYADIPVLEIDPALGRFIMPEAELCQLLENGDVNVIQEYLANEKEKNKGELPQPMFDALEGFFDELFYQEAYEHIYRFAPVIPHRFLLGENIGAFVYAACLADDPELIRATLKELGHPCAMANNIGSFVYEHLMPEQEWEVAIRMFTHALELETGNCNKLEVYCNALYVLQKDNTGLPVNKELNHKFLGKCLPFAPRNPAIYFNAACLYVEMNDFENTLNCIRLAKEHKYDGYDTMMKEIAGAPMFAEFVASEGFKKYKAGR